MRKKGDALRNSPITRSGLAHKTTDSLTGNGTVADNVLINQLVQQVLGWRVAPDRFLTANRSWIPRWKFNPLERLEAAFRLLNDCGPISYTIWRRGNFFQVNVKHGGKIGRAVGNSLPRALTLALARSLGLEV